MTKRILLMAILFLVPALARADSVWTFEGNLTDPGTWHGGQPITHCNCDLDGTVLFDDNFKVLAYSFTDGTHTLNNHNSTIVFPYLVTAGGRDLAGQLFTEPLSPWSLQVSGQGVFFSSVYNGPSQGATSMNTDYVGTQLFGYGQPNSGPDGTWTEVVSTPEPASITLLLAGLSALALLLGVRTH
jgi:hypothetical protein